LDFGSDDGTRPWFWVYVFLANVNRFLEQRKGQIGGGLTDAGSYINAQEWLSGS